MVFQCSCEELKRGLNSVMEVYGVKRPITGKTLAEKLGIKIQAVSALPEERKKVCLELASDGAGFLMEDGSYLLIYNDGEDESMCNFHILENVGHIIFHHNKFDDVENAQAEYFARYCMDCDSRKETG